MQENSPAERIYNGIIKENPTLVIVLGMCPTLAVTTSAMNGIGMGLSTTVVLTLSNLFISLFRNIIPDKIRIPAFIVIIASFVTIVDMLMEGFTPALYAQLGIYIPLIVVNCIIFGRAEAYASKANPVSALFDGIGMGLGFTISITIIGFIRELIGAGSIFGTPIGNLSDFMPSIFVMAPGAFMVLATIITIRAYIINRIEEKNGTRLEVVHTDEDGAGCAGCAFKDNCAGKSKKIETAAAAPAVSAAKAAAAAPAAKAAAAPVNNAAANTDASAGSKAATHTEASAGSKAAAPADASSDNKATGKEGDK